MSTLLSSYTISSAQDNENILHFLDKGIDDMEAGRILPLEDAFCTITELREKHRHGK